MKIGTKSVLFGAHQFLIHPWFVAAGWWKLYGFPRDLWLWIAFFVHDIGYWGKPNMDGPEGELHPWTGARILYRLQAWWIFASRFIWKRDEIQRARPVLWWHFRRKLAMAHLAVGHERVCWGNEALFHSRFLAKRYGARPSRLCVADNLAIALTPAWLYLPLVTLSGEIHEYMGHSGRMRHSKFKGEPLTKYEHMQLETGSASGWKAAMDGYILRWVQEHKDGREDTWTPGAVA
jgi:hypothetical protein